MMIMEVFTTHLNQNLMIIMINIKKNQQNNNIDSKLLNFSNYLKSLSPEAQDLMDKIEDADDDIDDDKLPSIDSNKKKKTLTLLNLKPLNVISAIYNGEISLKEAEFSQKNLEKKKKS